jgi:hypothetical protein
MSRPGAAAVLLTAAVVLLFVAHEPLLVLLGHRGARALAEDGPRARGRLAALFAAAAVSGAAGLLLAPPAARWALLLPLALGALVAWLLGRRLEKTVLGELSVLCALSSSGAVVALAGGASKVAALAALSAFLIAFTASTLAVHAVLARPHAKGGHDPGPLYAVGAALLGGLAALLFAAGLPGAIPLAAAPPVVVSFAVCLAKVSPRRLRPLGWTLAAASTATLVLLVLFLR